MSKKKTKYIVKCPYCEKNYIIESEHGEDFCCPTCSGAATLKDAVKIEEPSEGVKQERKNVFANKWMKLDRPSWYGENKHTPAEEEESDFLNISSDKAYRIFIFFVAIILLVLRIWLDSY